MNANSAKALLESLRKGVPPDPFNSSISVLKSKEETIQFLTPQTVILEIEQGNGQSHALLEIHQQAKEKGFITHFLKLGQGEQPILKNANHTLWQIVQNNLKIFESKEHVSDENEISKSSNLLAQMLGWDEELDAKNSLLQDYFQEKPPANQELFFQKNKRYQTLLQAIAAFSDANKQTLLILDGIEAELDDYQLDKDYQAAWENLAYLLAEQNFVKCVCALSPAFIHSFSFKMLLRNATSFYPPNLIKRSEVDSDFILSLCQQISDVYKLAYDVQISIELLYQKAVAVSTIREMVKTIVQTLDDANET
jgi:hypothetical protein